MLPEPPVTNADMPASGSVDTVFMMRGPPVKWGDAGATLGLRTDSSRRISAGRVEETQIRRLLRACGSP